MSTIAPPGGKACDLRYPVIVIDADGRPISISPGLRAALGLGSDNCLPDSLRAIMDEASAWRVYAALRYGGEAQRGPLVLRFQAPAGGPWDAAAEFVPTTEGGAMLVVSFEPGPWSGEDAALLLDHSQDLVFSVRMQPAFSFRYVNAASTPITGYGPDELCADPTVFTEAIHPDDRGSVDAALVDVRRLGAPVIFRFRHRSGEWRWFEFFGTPVADEAGRVAVVDGIVRDVTVRHRLEEQFRLLVERSPEMVYRIRLVPYCVTDYMSPACEAVTGHPPEEFYSNPWLLLRYVHPDDRPLLERCVECPGDFCSRPLLFRVFHPDGSLHWIEQMNVPVHDEAAGLIAIEGVCRDVTERQEVEATLQGMNRRMNLLASLTRHDILNQLTVLLGSLELAGTAENTTELAWFLSRSRDAAWAIQRLAEFTRDYQEIGQGAPGWVSVPALVRRAADSFAGERVVIEVPNEPCEIRADPLIEQVFYTLIENALRHGGTVGRVRFSIEAQPAGGLRIVCEDDGEGVPVNEKERIFERGYGRNTGLGLYLSSEILAITGMTITETGRPGIGARFEIRVPPGAYRLGYPPNREGLLLHNS
ncbi:MAG: PAS domain-containing sensor histidine kinase [Methanospirillum sp.]